MTAADRRTRRGLGSGPFLLPERVLRKIRALASGCWEWAGWRNDAGYGYTRWEGRDVPVHRLMMAALGFGVEALDVDHLCRNRACCNPNHLEPVSHAVNMDRTRPDRCRRAGHDWSDPRNVYVRPNGRRCCAACSREDQRRRWQQRRAA